LGLKRTDKNNECFGVHLCPESSEAEARLNNIKEFSPYRKENTTLHHYKDQLVNAVQGNSRCLF
jgi:hypothetical protein